MGVSFLFELLAVVSYCDLFHSYTPKQQLHANSLSNSLTSKVSLLLLMSNLINRCVSALCVTANA